MPRPTQPRRLGRSGAARQGPTSRRGRDPERLVPAWQLVKLAKAHRALVGDALAELGLHVGQDLLLAELVPLVAEPAPSPSAELAQSSGGEAP
jgi:hypothetical protein